MVSSPIALLYSRMVEEKGSQLISSLQHNFTILVSAIWRIPLENIIVGNHMEEGKVLFATIYIIIFINIEIHTKHKYNLSVP